MDSPNTADDAPQSEQPLPSSSSEPAQSQEPQPLQRVPSGTTGLDTILNGGFLQGGIYFISGQPGTGKTILSNQMAFNHVASGGRAVFASILSETHDRLFSYLQPLSFFNPEPIGNALYYISGYGTVQKEGLKGLLALLHGAIRDNHATLLIVDGMLNAEAFAPSNLGFKEFIHQLQLYAGVYSCTVLLLNSADGGGERSTDLIAGQTTVDGLIRLTNRLAGLRSVRELYVQKFRGSGYLEGAHTLQINSDGIDVYPRLEAVFGPAAEARARGWASVEATSPAKASRERLVFGVAGLDELLHGGLLKGSSTVLLGPIGSGKTLLGLHFLAAGARQGERGLYFGLNEPSALSIDAGNQIGLNLSSLVEEGLIQVLWRPALEEPLDTLAHAMLAAIREHGAQRLFIDGLDALDDINLNTERVPLFFTALMGELRSLGVTTTSAVALGSLFGPSADIPIKGVAASVENIIFLRSVELRSELQRLISILKTRRSGHNGAITEFKITDHGIELGGKFEGAEAILTGVARTLRGIMG